MASRKPLSKKPVKRTVSSNRRGKNTGWRERWLRSSSRVKMVTFVLLFALVGAGYVLYSHAQSPGPTYSGKIPDPGYASNQILVKFNVNVPAAVQDKLLARFSARVTRDMPQIGVKEITVPDEALDAVTEALSHNPAVQFAEKDAFVAAQDTTPNDAWWPAEWSEVTTQTNKAWDRGYGSPNVTIAVLDSGIDYTQPDLQGRFVPGQDVVNNDADPTDDNGHGTMVAGVAGASTNNTIGIASYCGGCSLMPVKVLGTDGTGATSNVATGIIWATDHGAKVINLSLGSTSASSTLDNAVSYAVSKGALVFAAAGNYGTSAKVYPAASPGAIGVAGTDSTNTLYSWSGYGSWVKIAAPGINMATGRNGWYGNFAGTSAAAPAASGIAGLVWSAKPTATNTEIQQALLTNADACCSNTIGGGRINAYKAMQALLGGTVTPPPSDTAAPTASITAPTSGSTLAGPVAVSVSAGDNVGISKVELYRNGSLVGSSTSAPYSFYWDTTTVTNGSYTLTAKAYDAAGNVGTSAAVSVTVSNTSDTTAPTVSITNPVTGSTIGNSTTVTASATDNKGVTALEVYVDGVLKASSTRGSINAKVNTRKLISGSHTITVKAYDAAGNVGQASIVVNKK